MNRAQAYAYNKAPFTPTTLRHTHSINACILVTVKYSQSRECSFLTLDPFLLFHSPLHRTETEALYCNNPSDMQIKSMVSNDLSTECNSFKCIPILFRLSDCVHCLKHIKYILLLRITNPSLRHLRKLHWTKNFYAI